MNKVLTILGSILAGIIIITVVTISFIAGKNRELNSESKAFVDQAVPAICADLRMETFSKYASAELLSTAPREEFQKYFNWFKRLGEYKEFKSSSGKTFITPSKDGEKLYSGEYIAEVEFSSGPASVHLETIKIDAEWKINTFKINSSVLKD